MCCLTYLLSLLYPFISLHFRFTWASVERARRCLEITAK